MKTTALWGALISTVLVTLAVLAPVSPARADDDDPGTTATYPAPTSFNPDVVTYTVHVESTNPGTLEVVDLYEKKIVRVDAAGDATLHMTANGRHVLKVQRCVRRSCVYSNVHPVYTYRDFVTTAQPRVLVGPHQPADVTYSAKPEDVAATLTWSVVDGEHVIARGTKGVVTGPGAHLSFSLPASTPTGTYELQWSLASDSADYGHLETDLKPVKVAWSAAAKPVRLELTSDSLYPARDGYHDKVKVIGHGHGQQMEAEIVAAGGAVVRTLTGDLERGVLWRGDGDDHRPVRPGRYTVRLIGHDQQGNTATDARRLLVGAGTLRTTVTTRTVKVARTVVSKTVGRCSTLASPAPGRGPGSLGSYSQTRCSRDDDSVVSTVNAIAMPASADGRYTHVTLTVRGGGARGERKAYAVLLYWDGEQYADRTQLDAHFGNHVGRTISHAEHRYVERNGKPTLYFAIGLTAGSRYDVQSVTLTATSRQIH